MEPSFKAPLSCIIPTFTNTTGLKKLVLFLKKLGYPLIVVDNHPTAEKKLLFSNHDIYLPQRQNLGFSMSINRAVPLSKTDWIAILNDDIEITDNHLFEKLLACALKNRYIAAAPLLKNPSGGIENAGYRVLPIGRVKLVNANEQTIDGLTAACLIIKKTTFDKIGGFDERFFAYLEDVDLFLRLKKQGQRFGVCGQTEVIHNHMTTSSKMGNFKQKQDLKNWLLLIIKHWDKKTLFSYFPQIIIERFRNLSGLIKATLA